MHDAVCPGSPSHNLFEIMSQPHATQLRITLARHVACGVALCCVLAWSTQAQARGRAPLDQAMSALGARAHTDCLASDARTPKQRRAYWDTIIAKLAERHPELLHQWLIGASAPPKVVMKEAIAQRDCMLVALTKDAAKSKGKLILDFGPETRATAYGMRTWAKRADTPKQAAKIGRALTRSHVRQASSQASIWRNKFLFLPKRPFNHISKQAAAKCKLKAGGSWKPYWKRHTYCWMHTLTHPQRQREILTASSAPGISRHHWGTDFDLFNLNPRKYQPKGPFADEYAWMGAHALEHGFVQPFVGASILGQYTYIEERWHWSYAPIAQALVGWSKGHQTQVGQALRAQWKRLADGWNGKRGKTDYFSYIQKHWARYMFNTAQVELAWAPLPAPLWHEGSLLAQAQPGGCGSEHSD